MVSHLPYAVAATLMRAVQSVGDEQLWEMAASGFRDTSRLAASDVTMMTDILLTNRAALLDALTRYRRELDSLIALIDAADPDSLHAALAPGQSKRARLFRVS
jgi:prephenate dehydrogenase